MSFVYQFIKHLNDIIRIRHHWEGEMGDDVVTNAEISQSRRTQRCSMYFLVRMSI